MKTIPRPHSYYTKIVLEAMCALSGYSTFLQHDHHRLRELPAPRLQQVVEGLDGAVGLLVELPQADDPGPVVVQLLPELLHGAAVPGKYATWNTLKTHDPAFTRLG